MKVLAAKLITWEATASDWSAWRATVRECLVRFAAVPAEQSETKRQRQKAANQTSRPSTVFLHTKCRRDWHSRIGLTSHTLKLYLQTRHQPQCSSMLWLVTCNRLVNLGICKQQHLYPKTKNLI